MKFPWLIIHILLLTLAAYLGADLVYAPLNSSSGHPNLSSGPESPVLHEPGQNLKPVSNREKQTVVLSRNLFNVLASHPKAAGTAPSEDLKINDLKPTQLKLALWGTVTGSGGTSAWAVVEDRKEKVQALYEVGDTVAGATIKKIMRNKIILTYQNQDQVLEVDPSLTPQPKAAIPVIQNPANLFRESIGSAAPLPGPSLELMKQVRIRPFFKEGTPQGMLLYGIKPESAFQNMGLKNGDIVQQINDTQTLRATDAKTIYQSAASQEETRMTILRRGKPIQLIYNPSDNTYTTEAAPNE